MKKPVQVYISSVLKACGSHVNAVGGGGRGTISSPPPPQITARTTTPSLLVGPPQLTRIAAAEVAKVSPTSAYNNDPCLDLFFYIKPLNPPTPDDYVLKPTPYSHKYLKHLLPLAWSQNPLTTLKLICNLLDPNGTGKNDKEGFFTAAYWLYQNHPNTLASNLAPIAASYGSFSHLLELLYRALEGEDVRTRNQQINTNESDSVSDPANNEDTSKNDSDPVSEPDPLELEISRGIEGRICSRKRRDKIFAMANKALERYRLDRNFRFLHDGISDLYAQCLKSDIQNFSNHHMINNGVDEIDNGFNITLAAKWCPSVDSIYDLATLLCESIGKKVFPRELEEEEADYRYRVRELLRKVLVPLRKALDSKDTDESSSNQWGYNPVVKPEPCPVKAYLEKVKAGGKSEINARALLPNQIVAYVNDPDVGEAAELQWKTMVEDMYLKTGKLKNCLVVCDELDWGKTMAPSGWEVAVSLAALTSELSEEPWKGKVMSYSYLNVPVLHSIQGDDLKSKCQFVRSMECGEKGCGGNIFEVYHLILKTAVEANLKPEQMIKKVFVFTPYEDMYDSELEFIALCWKNHARIHAEVIHSEFKKKGYAAPEIVYWNLNNETAKRVRSSSGQEKWVMLGGFSNEMVKAFLDNDGSVGPDHVMEAAIAGEEYQSLVVVD